MICLLCRNIRGVIYSLSEEGPAHISEYANHDDDQDVEGDDSNGIVDNYAVAIFDHGNTLPILPILPIFPHIGW